MEARENAIILSHDFASYSITHDSLWNMNNLSESIAYAAGTGANRIRDLFQFIADATITETLTYVDRTALLYSNTTPSMRLGLMETLEWLQDKLSTDAGLAYIWVDRVGLALGTAEKEDQEGRGYAADLAFDLLLNAIPTTFNRYAAQFRDVVAKFDTIFGRGTGNGASRNRLQETLIIRKTKRNLAPPKATAFEAHYEMQLQIVEFWRQMDEIRGSINVMEQLDKFREWWMSVAMYWIPRFLTAGAREEALLIPSNHFMASRQTLGDVWVRSLERIALDVLACRDYDEHVMWLGTVGDAMLFNLGIATLLPSIFISRIAIRMHQKLMHALTTILGAGSPPIEVMRLKGIIIEIGERYVPLLSHNLQIHKLIDQDELRLLQGVSAATTFTFGNLRHNWSPRSLDPNEVKWTHGDRDAILLRDDADDVARNMLSQEPAWNS
jgi:hypothetical protein